MNLCWVPLSSSVSRANVSEEPGDLWFYCGHTGGCWWTPELTALLYALVTLPPESRLGTREAVDCRDLKLGKGLSSSHWRAKPAISDFA